MCWLRVEAVLAALRRLSGQPSLASSSPDSIDVATGHRLLDEHTEAVLGPRPVRRGVSIMVTMPSEAADDYTLVTDSYGKGWTACASTARTTAPSSGPGWWRIFGV